MSASRGGATVGRARKNPGGESAQRISKQVSAGPGPDLADPPKPEAVQTRCSNWKKTIFERS